MPSKNLSDVASTVNKTLMALVARIPNLYYIGHPQFGYADVQAFEDSSEHGSITRDGLHQSYEVINCRKELNFRSVTYFC